MVLLVKYQLNKAGKDYTSLYKAIQSLGTTLRDPMMHTAWFASTPLTPVQAYNVIAPHIDANDRIFITRLRANEYYGWFDKSVVTWLASNVV